MEVRGIVPGERGNITDDISISVPANQWQAISPEQLRGETLRAMRDPRSNVARYLQPKR